MYKKTFTCITTMTQMAPKFNTVWMLDSSKIYSIIFEQFISYVYWIHIGNPQQKVRPHKIDLEKIYPSPSSINIRKKYTLFLNILSDPLRTFYPIQILHINSVTPCEKLQLFTLHTIFCHFLPLYNYSYNGLLRNSSSIPLYNFLYIYQVWA